MKPSSSFITPEGEVPYWRTNIGEKEKRAVLKTIEDKSFSVGSATAEMESEISKALNVPYVLCTTSGSMAMVMGLMAAGIGPGDEVLVPTRTFIATAHAASLLGAKPVLVDCLENSTEMDVAHAEKKVTPRTRAIMPVHLNGRSCDMEVVEKVARKHGLVIIEDACQSFLSRGSEGHLGTLGDFGCFSFGMVKLVNTGQGGAIVTRWKELFEKLKDVRNHGVADTISHTYLSLGHNFKFNDIQASIGIWQVKRGPEKAAHVNAIYERYMEGLEGVPFINILPVDTDGGEVALWTEVLCDDRDSLMDYLVDRGIQTRKFMPCVHTAPHYNVGESFPNSERFHRIGFNLPGGPDLPLEYVDRTISALKEYDH